MSHINENNESNERYLSFFLAAEEYAIPLLAVREVIAMPELTPVPFTPSHFVGIMNLRGQVISVLDLRKKLGVKQSEHTETSVIICDFDPVCVGVIVDSIHRVLSPRASELSSGDELQSERNIKFITGVYRDAQKLVVLLDLVRAFQLPSTKAA